MSGSVSILKMSWRYAAEVHLVEYLVCHPGGAGANPVGGAKTFLTFNFLLL